MSDYDWMEEPKEPSPNEFARELTALINKHSIEKFSNTPDWVLSEYIMGCLRVFSDTTKLREAWYGRDILDLGGSSVGSTED